MSQSKNAKKPETKVTFVAVVAVVAEYDESGSDGLVIDSALIFDDVQSVADFILEDYNDTLINAFGEDDEEHDALTKSEVTKAIKRLEVDTSTEWDLPNDAQVWVKWKVFRKA